MHQIIIGNYQCVVGRTFSVLVYFREPDLIDLDSE